MRVRAYVVGMGKPRHGVEQKGTSVHDAVSPQRTGCTVASPDADTELTLDDGLLTFYIFSLERWPDKLCNTCPPTSGWGARDRQNRTGTWTKPDNMLVVWTDVRSLSSIPLFK